MATQTSLSVSFSLGCKANIGNYESTDAHVSRSEVWDVSGLDQADIDKLYDERLVALKEELDEIITREYKEMKA